MASKQLSHLLLSVLITAVLAAGCAHYPVNPPLKQCSPDLGYRLKNKALPEKSEDLLLILSFSGGGTRAAALSYGVLETLADTRIRIAGENKRMIDEVDLISSVSGGSFTAAYYGLFGDRIFKDFEPRFLKKNIQGALIVRQLLFPRNWFRLASPFFSNNDLAAEYYDKYVFDGKTFGDMALSNGPAIIINATDVTEGVPFVFEQEMFDLICSNLWDFPVARAAAASSAVPVVLSPITLRNYGGTCGFEPAWIGEALKERTCSPRRYYHAVHAQPYLDTQKKPYIHLADGGLSDNLGLRVVIERCVELGNAWESLKSAGMKHTRKFVFVVVNAESQPDVRADLFESSPGPVSVLSSATTNILSRYNIETLELLRLNFDQWAKDIRSGRCKDPEFANEKDACGDIEFYLITVDFNTLADESERTYLKDLPTSFTLPPESIDALRIAARKILTSSIEFQRLLKDLE